MCDCLVALRSATIDDVTLFAKNSDRPEDERALIERCEPRRETTTTTTYLEIAGHVAPTLRTIVSRPDWCWGAEHGVNEAGVAIGNEAIYTTQDPRLAAPALIGMDLVRLALERATTAAAAVSVITQLLERYGQGGSGHHPRRRTKPYWSSFLIADPDDSWILETSGQVWAAEQVSDVAAISNRTCIAHFDADHRHPKQPVAMRVDPRLEASQRLLAAQPVTRSALEAHLRSHDSCAEPGWSVCMHVEGLEATTSSVIAELPVGAAPTVWMLLGSPCQQQYVRHEF